MDINRLKFNGWRENPIETSSRNYSAKLCDKPSRKGNLNAAYNKCSRYHAILLSCCCFR